MKSSLVFLGTLLVSLFIQGLIWHQFEFVDKYMWIDATKCIQTMDPCAFNAKTTYAHPGTFAIEIAIIAHLLGGISYTASFLGALTLVNSLIIASISLLCYRLQPQSWWWFIASGLLIFNRLFPAATPTSAVIAPLIVLLFLLSLSIYEKKSSNTLWLSIFWGLSAGIGAATRTDITTFVSLFLLLFLWPRLGWKKISFILSFSILIFILADPFMWVLPLKHPLDLVLQVHHHYAEFTPSHLSLSAILLISPLAIVSLLLAFIFLIKRRDLPLAISHRFLGLMLFITFIFSAVLSTSHFQASRYLFPFAFLWEAFLPLFILNLIPRVRFSFLHSPTTQQTAIRLMQISLAILLVGGQAVMLIHLYFIPQVIFVCLNQHNRWLICGQSSALVW